jgi:glyoxylase-like metal-dependent hydrolase (beta-lactamase superfamily II)
MMHIILLRESFIMSETVPLHLDVHVAPMRPMKGAPPQGPGDESMWSPMSATLIYGRQDAVLVDTLVTFDQVDALADWIDRFEKNLTAIYITHGHSDHWIGLGRLLERFPGARGVARPDVQARAAFEATNPGLSAYWQSIFPGEVPEQPVLPDRFEDTSIDLEGHELRLIDIGQGDTEHSTILHAPSIGAVVGGDVVYNEVHMMMGEVDEHGREAWIGSLDQIASLQPQIVVSGHPRVGAPSVPKTIGESQQYLRDFTRVATSEDTIEGIVTTMLELHPDRDNPRVVWHSAREEIKRRQPA